MRRRFSSASSSDDPYLERIRFEQVDELYRNMEVGVLGAFMGSIALAAGVIAFGDLSWTAAAAWMAGAVGCVSFHLAIKYFYRRVRNPEMAWRRWACGFTAAMLADGIGWGSATIFLVDRADAQILTLLVANTVAIGAVATCGSYMPAFLAIFLPITLLSGVWHATQGGTLHHAAAVLIGVFVVTMSRLAWLANANFIQRLRLHFEKEALAEEFRRQKEIAEEANLSKSRFLAAASHDLRQPIHGLGMFVGALARHPMNDEMRRLVENIEGSIDLMEGLFNALLDMSRLDAGVVKSHLQWFPIGPFLERVCQVNAEEALQKNLSFIQCSSTAIVYSDPVLLERILRNLVSNAVRYTDRGKILVGCRRRGQYLSLQVWDTGRGIAVGEQDRVFQEFYQAGTSEPHRDKGLGLGLAIVKRLAILLDHPLELSSELGRGTAFKLLLPATCQEATSTPATLSLAPCFAPSALILVIEDAFTAREAMRDLLTSWGYDVIVAASRADMLARITQCPSPPDLILCGYRLQGETMGVDLIRSLHAEYNEDIPAALIIDDATSDGVQAAREARIAVLSKPIANSKLRAMIGNLMNKPRASDQAEYAA